MMAELVDLARTNVLSRIFIKFFCSAIGIAEFSL